MKYVLIWSTVREGVAWKPFSDDEEGRAALLEDLKKLQTYGAFLLYWKVFREDTAAVYDELTTPKGGDGGGLDC